MPVDYSVDTFLWIFEGIFGAIHIMMIIFIIQKRRKQVEVYTSPFYVIFLWICLFDLIYVINNDIGAKLSKYPSLRSFYTSDSYYPTAFYFISAYTSSFEICGHTILSINRYFVIKNAQINKARWSKRVRWIFYLLLFLAPMPTTVFRLFTPARYKYSEEGVPSISYIDPNVSKISSYANIGYYTVNFIPSLIVTVLASMNYQYVKQSKYEITPTDKHELKLIIHSVCMFLLLAGRYAYQITLLIASYTKSINILTVAQFFFPIIASFYSLISSFILLVINSQVRHDFFEFYGLKKIPGYSNTKNIQIY